MTEPRVRFAKQRDAKAIRKLFAMAEYVGGGDYSAYHIDDVRAYIERDFVIVVTYNTEIIGAIWDVKYPRHLVGGACAVRVDYQKLGVYKMMWKFRWQWAKANGIRYLESSTVVGNQRMTNLFKRNGYVKESTLNIFTKTVR